MSSAASEFLFILDTLSFRSTEDVEWSILRRLNDSRQHPPVTLRALGAFEAAKGALALAAACGILSLRHTDLHAAADTFLLNHGIDPERHYTRLFIESIARATHQDVGPIVAFCVIYGLIRIAEGYGLWQGRHWAEWFAVISAGLYLPFEVRHFAHRVSLLSGGLVLVNVALVIYLARLLKQQRARTG